MFFYEEKWIFVTFVTLSFCSRNYSQYSWNNNSQQAIYIHHFQISMILKIKYMIKFYMYISLTSLAVSSVYSIFNT